MLINFKKKHFLSLLLASIAPFSAFAHAGHDHHSNWSFLVHAVWLAPIILAAYFLMNVLNKKKSPSKER